MSDVAQRLSFSEEEVKNDAMVDVYRDGAVVKLTIDKVDYKWEPTRGKGPGEDCIQNTRVSVLHPDTEQRLKGNSLFIWTCMPLVHPDYRDSHVPPNYAKSMWEEYATGFIPERQPQKPRKIDGVLHFNGEAVSFDKIAELEITRRTKLKEEAIFQVQGKGQDLLRRTCYATIKHSADKNTGELRVNASRLRPELYDGEELTPYDALFVKVIPGAGMVDQEASTEGAAEEETSSRRKRRG